MASGEQSYFGFEYQIYMSVLLMLLEHQQGQFSTLYVETSFGHDATISHGRLEKLELEEEKTLTTKLTSNQISNKHIQIKTKVRKYEWGVSDFREVLLKKNENSPLNSKETVLDYLFDNEQEIFIFVTDGKVHTKLTGLLVSLEYLNRHVSGDFTQIKNDIIKSVRDQNSPILQDLNCKLTPTVLDRVLIIDGLGFQIITERINNWLHRVYGFPASETSTVMKRLVDLVRDKMLRVDGSNDISIDQLKKIVGEPTPSIHYSQLKDQFVTTSQFNSALQTIEQHHLVIIVGEPATGKTTIAQSIINEYSVQLYKVEDTTPRNDAHLAIKRACQTGNDTIFLLDDLFGDIEFDPQSKTFGVQINNLLDELNEAKSRVKVVITARRHVFAQICKSTRMDDIDLNYLIVNIPYPDTELLEQVLILKLRGISENHQQYVLSMISFAEFEDLLHVRLFAEAINKSPSNELPNVNELLLSTRPSDFEKWIATLKPAYRLLLYVLWGVVKTDQYANESDVQRIYEVTSNCISLPQYEGFGTWYDDAIEHLANNQSRIVYNPNDKIDFIHPKLGQAVGRFLRDKQKGFNHFMTCWLKTLAGMDTPLEQSVAVMLGLHFRDYKGIPLGTLKTLAKSKYVQTREAFIKFDGTDFTASLFEKFEMKDSPPRFFISVEDCEIDNQGFLIIVYDKEYRSYHGEQISKIILWRAGVLDEKDEGELLNKFNRVLKEKNLTILNDIEQYRFGRYLKNVQELQEQEFLTFISTIGISPISFVRASIAWFINRFFEKQHLQTLIGSQAIDTTTIQPSTIDNIKDVKDKLSLQQQFHNLCYDWHPAVKIAMLEQAILPTWRFQSSATQKAWLNIVVDMLDDWVVKQHVVIGLIGKRGSKYHYHENHTLEQEIEWFITVASKILEDEFDLSDSFSRFLERFDELFPDLPIPYRTNLLQRISNYVETYPVYAVDTPYTIYKLILRYQTNQQERDILIDLIRKLSPPEHIDILYNFARDYQNLFDNNFKEFVHRSFFNESPQEYIAERGAVLMGFLANETATFENLPLPVQNYSDDDLSSAIREYIFAQDSEFKRMVIFLVHQYERVYHVSTRYDGIFKTDIVLDLIDDFIANGTEEDVVLIADVILRSSYYAYMDNLNSDVVTQEKDTKKWLELADSFIEHSNPNVCKRVCDIIFAANIESNVHDIYQFLFFVYRFLNHSQLEVQTHAFELFDKHFHKIWVEDLHSPYHNEYRQDKLNTAWYSKKFTEKLYKNSKSFRLFAGTYTKLRQIRDCWNRENISAKEKQDIVDYFCQIANAERYELVKLAIEFYSEFKEQLSSEQQKQLEESIYVDNEYGGHDERVRMKKIKNEQQMRSLYPQMDWSVYFD